MLLLCNLDDMHQKLQQLEDRLMKKIANLLQIMFDTNKTENSYNIKLNENENGIANNNIYDTGYYYKNLADVTRRNDAVAITTEAPPLRKNFTNFTKKLRNFEREFQHNNSIINDEEHGKTFVYYWKIDGITKTLQEKDIYVTSPHFLVKGMPIKILIYVF